MLLLALSEPAVEVVVDPVELGDDLLHLVARLADEGRRSGRAGELHIGIGVGLSVIDEHLKLGLLTVLVHHEVDGVHALVRKIIEAAAERGEGLRTAVEQSGFDRCDIVGGVYLVCAVADAAVQAVVGDIECESDLQTVARGLLELDLDLAVLVGDEESQALDCGEPVVKLGLYIQVDPLPRNIPYKKHNPAPPRAWQTLIESVNASCVPSH